MVYATTAEETLRTFRHSGHHVALLIDNVALLKSSGIHVASLLRFAVGDLPVILTSAHPVSDWSGRDVSDFIEARPRSGGTRATTV